ncbi:MAG TPA: putative lipopolysaccharide heptosyltransferase III [Gallionella sp.]|nr:putative lipopolysaccharide heptosyltransferase III [Gallionella sp.]
MLKDAIDFSPLRRVLVIKLRHHGDVLLTSPVFSVLKEHAPHLEIDALVYQDTAEMLTFHPAISQVHAIDRKWKSSGFLAQAQAEWKLLSTLRARRYDLIVHLTEHPRGAWITKLAGAKFGIAKETKGKGRLWKSAFTHLFTTVNRGNCRHTVETHLDALRRIGIHPDEQERKLILVPGQEAEESIEKMLTEHQLEIKNFIHLHPTSRWFFKCWPIAKMAALISSLQEQGYRIVITAAPAREELAMTRAILASLRQPVVDLSGQLSLKQLAALSARARLFIGVDSAPMHIAAAMGTPSVALFGPSGDIEWGPWQVAHRIIRSDHPCRPCGNDGCGGSKVSECLTTIPVEHVLGAARELLRLS